MSLLTLVCLLTFIHYTGAQMRGPVVPLYAASNGATAAGVGFIVAAHMLAAAVGSIPLGRASDVWGRRPLMLGGIAVGVLTSLLLPLAEGRLALATIYGLAGLGVAAFTPSALSLAADVAAPGRVGQALAWYTTAHYGAIGVGPFLGGLAAQWWGYRGAFVGSAVGISMALLVGLAMPAQAHHAVDRGARATFTEVRGNAGVWAGWILAAAGMLTQGVVFTFVPLLGHERGLTHAGIGLVFLVLGLANTLARFPAGWLVDRTGRCTAYAIAGIVVASVTTAVLPHIEGRATLLGLAALFGVVSGVAGVALGVALAGAVAPTARGVVMGGYSTALYLGLALGSFALGPVIAQRGYAAGFAVGGAAGTLGAAVAGILWIAGERRSRPFRSKRRISARVA